VYQEWSSSAVQKLSKGENLANRKTLYAISIKTENQYSVGYARIYL